MFYFGIAAAIAAKVFAILMGYLFSPALCVCVPARGYNCPIVATPALRDGPPGFHTWLLTINRAGVPELLTGMPLSIATLLDFVLEMSIRIT